MTPTPTRARHVVTLFAMALAVITYVDRAAINVSALYIRQDLGLSPIQMGWAFAAFGWAYAVFEIPGGWLGDKIGPRRVLLRIVLWWSLFTAATGWAWSAASLIAIRALFGAGEAGAFPNMTRMFTTWLPVRERERAQAILAFPDALIMSQARAIADFSVRQRVPAVSGWAEFAMAGNFMSYGPSLRESWRRAAGYVDLILRGARPGELPVEQPTRFELVINRKVAEALGVTLPPSLLVRADRIIE